MTQKLKTRPRGGVSRAPKMLILADSFSENTRSLPIIQACFIARRFGLTPIRAALLANLCFGEGAR